MHSGHGAVHQEQRPQRLESATDHDQAGSTLLLNNPGVLRRRNPAGQYLGDNLISRCLPERASFSLRNRGPGPARGAMSSLLPAGDDPVWAVVATVMAVILATVFFFAQALRRRSKAARRPAPAGGTETAKPPDLAKQNERDASEHPPCRVADLFVYPIKSCAGMRLKTARTCATGFENDRRYMIINAKVPALPVRASMRRRDPHTVCAARAAS